MKDILVIINYMRTNPTIVDDLVIKMKDQFKKIYIVNRNTQNEYENIINIPNVEIREVKKINRTLLIPYSIISLMRKECLDDILYAIKMHRFNIEFIINIAKGIHIANLLYGVVKEIDELKTEPERISMLSVWFTSEAYVIAKIKEKHPMVRGISMAHAHEIETFDNKYTFLFKKYSQSRIDKVCFIADAKMRVYIKEVCQRRGIDTSNMRLIYWGSEHFDFAVKEKIKTNKSIIVSCSTVEELKRVNLIAEAIKLCENNNIEWYHFGDGAGMQELEKLVHGYDANIQDRIHLLGRIENWKVKEFYATHDIELFINVSTTEGLPISVMEAMSYSIPAIVTDVGGEREIIDNRVNGYIIPSDITAEYLAYQINKYLTLNEIIRDDMKKAARKKWEDKFNLNININQYIEELKCE